MTCKDVVKWVTDFYDLTEDEAYSERTVGIWLHRLGSVVFSLNHAISHIPYHMNTKPDTQHQRLGRLGRDSNVKTARNSEMLQTSQQTKNSF